MDRKNFILSSLILHLVNSLLVICEDTVFRIRKCCAENELILERTGQCSEYKLLEASKHVYYLNDTSDERGKRDRMGSKNWWPWWFPPDIKILSKRTNNTLTDFPKKYHIIAGSGQPCREAETSYLPTYFYKYTFYDDGSILLHPNNGEEYHVLKSDILFDPLSFCIDRLDLDVDDSKEEGFEPVLDITETTDYMVMLCPCTKATCILKCCEPGMLFDMRNENGQYSCNKNTGDDWMPVYSKEEEKAPNYFLLHGTPECKFGESIVLPNYQTNNPGYVIFSNGTAHIEGETYISQYMEFCGDNIIDNNMKIQNHILRCFPKYGIKGSWFEIRRILYGWLSVFGALFLLSTLMIHTFLPSLKKLNDKSLICQTWCLFVGYVGIAISQLAGQSLTPGFCAFIGFLIQYCFLAAFFWLNVLCFDISYTFSSIRIVHRNYRQHTLKNQMFYSCYGWITPALIVIVTAVMEYYPNTLQFILKPKIKERCWFQKGSYAVLAYFYGPIAILLVINLVLFVYTSFKIMHTRNEISTAIRSKNMENQRFLLYLKLFVLMGISWITELISWVVGGPEYYWFVTDIINLLRAVFIFVTICCKRQVVDELKKKFGLKEDNGVRRPSNTRSSVISIQCGEPYKVSNSADSIL